MKSGGIRASRRCSVSSDGRHPGASMRASVFGASLAAAARRFFARGCERTNACTRAITAASVGGCGGAAAVTEGEFGSMSARRKRNVSATKVQLAAKRKRKNRIMARFSESAGWGSDCAASGR